jgi:hypothetical protein
MSTGTDTGWRNAPANTRLQPTAACAIVSRGG